MNNKREYYDKPIFTIGNHVWYILVSNFYFLLLNPLFLMLLFAVGGGSLTAVPIPVVALCSLTLGPSLSALLSTMGKLVREKDLNLTSYFFKSYKDNFKQSIIVNLILTLLFTVLYLDITYLLAKSSLLVYFFYVLTVFLVLASFYAFIIIARFNLGIRDIIKLAVACPIVYFMNSITSIVILIACEFVFFSIAGLAIFFIPSLLCYLLMLNHKKVLEKIETNLCTS